jgi:hypothetical protein
MQAGVRSVGCYLWRVSGLPNWYTRLTVTLRHALTGRVAEPYVPESKRVLVVREAACSLGLLQGVAWNLVHFLPG